MTFIQCDLPGQNNRQLEKEIEAEIRLIELERKMKIAEAILKRIEERENE